MVAQFNVQKALAGLENNVGSLVFAKLHDYATFQETAGDKVITAPFMKVIVSLSSKGNPAECAKAIANAFDYSYSPVVASFRQIPGKHNAYVGFIAANTASVEYDTKEHASYKVVAGNLLLNEADKTLWQLHSSSNGTKYLTRHAEENLADLKCLASVVDNRVVGMPVLSNLATAAANGEFVSYFSPKHCAMRYGMVLAYDEYEDELEVYDLEDGEEEVVSDDMVVESAKLDFSEVPVAKIETAASKAEMVDYYTKVFGYDKAYLSQLISIINSNSVV